MHNKSCYSKTPLITSALAIDHFKFKMKDRRNKPKSMDKGFSPEDGFSSDSMSNRPDKMT